MNLINSKDVHKRDQDTSPVERMIQKVKDESDEPILSLPDMAKLLGIHNDTLRRICRSDKVSAPSLAWQRGGMVIYFFTEDDVKELQKYVTGKREQ